MSARITKTTTGQYHQVLALTQYMINLGLDNLFKEKGFENPNRPAKNFKASGSGFSNLVLGSPRIIIETLDDNHTNVYCRIHLKSGTFKANIDGPEGADPGPEDLAMASYVVNDWYFAFGHKLFSQTMIPKKKDALEKLKRLTGKYTVQQLMVNMKTARMNDALNTGSSFGVWTAKDVNLNGDSQPMNQDKMKVGQPRNWEAEPAGVRKTFGFVITLVIDDLIKNDLQNLGVTAEAADAGRLSVTDPGHPPTFMPIDCRFQTYPWMDPNDSNYKEYNGIDGNGRLNYLLYLEMTGNNDGTKPEVKQEGRFLKGVGNWTDGRNPSPGPDRRSMFGTFMLTHQKFLTEFLLPKFDKMNRMVKMDLSDLKAEVYTKGLYSYFSRDVKIAIGAGVKEGYDAGDAAYRFLKASTIEQMITKLIPAGVWFDTPLPTNALVWYWYFIDEPMNKHSEDRYLNIGYNAEHWGRTASYTVTRLSIVPGSNQIKFEGFSSSTLFWEKDWDIVPNRKSQLNCNAKWTMTMSMIEVSDGGLQFKIESVLPSPTFSGENSGDLSFYETYMKDSYSQAGQNFTAITNSLKNSLKGQEQFFLPASGIYFFKNPIFNHEGSLLCELEYNGNAQIETPNKDASKRSSVGDTTVQGMPAGVSSPTSTTEENKNNGKGSK